MNRCLICEKVIDDTFSSLVGEKYKICYMCFNAFEKRNVLVEVDGVECLILYYYDEFFKSALYKYKGCFDYALKDVFITYNLKCLKRKYKGHCVVMAPSNKSREDKRGYNHLEEIFKCLGLKIINCFKKVEEWKQSDKKMIQREEVQNIIKIDKSALKGIKKVVLVDDVLTSGSTLRAMIKQIPTNVDKKALILASNCRVLKNEIV